MVKEELSLPSTVKAYSGILLSITFFLGVFGNSLNILSVALYKRLNGKPMNILIVNLSVCGLLIDIIGVPSAGLYITQEWPAWLLPHAMCSISSFVTHTCSSCMVLTLLLVAVERYFASVKRKVIPLKLIVISLFGFWITTASIHSTHSFESLKLNRAGTNVTTCDLIIGDRVHDDIRTTIVAIAILSIILMTTSLTFHLVVGYHLRQLHRMKMPSSSKTFIALLQDFKLTLIITMLFICFWLPTWILTTIQKHENNIKGKIVVLANTLSIITTIFTPFVCIMFSKHFRRTAKDIFRGCKTSTIRAKPQRKLHRNSHKDPLTTHQTSPTNEDYEELDTPPVFEKGFFRSCSNNQNMENVSIDSKEFSPLRTARDNNSYTGSEEHLEKVKTTM